MIAELGLENVAGLAHFHSKNNVFESLDHTAAREKSKVACVLRTVRMLAGHLVEIRSIAKLLKDLLHLVLHIVTVSVRLMMFDNV